MKLCNDRTLLFTLLIGFSLESVQACRFWCAIGDLLPSSFIQYQLLDAPQSLKNLGGTYKDGWSLGFYQNGEPMLWRGALGALEDTAFNEALQNLLEVPTQIVVGHLRRASSGCVEGVPNPHPFVREFLGRQWVFGHNGGMRKQLLLDLIGEAYLNEHAPEVCAEDPPESWIDSELYFIWLMQQIESTPGGVGAGLVSGLSQIMAVISEENQYLNFFLSDGQTLWAFRKGTSLFYLDHPSEALWAVASTIPDPHPDWKAFPENQLGRFQKGQAVQFFPVLTSQKSSLTESTSIINPEVFH